MAVTAAETSARRAMLACRIGAELLQHPSPDWSQVRVAGWAAMRDLVEETPGLRAVRVTRTTEGLGFGPWLGPFPEQPVSVPFAGKPHPDAPEVLDVLNRAAGASCTWEMISYPQLLPEVAVALGHPERVDLEVLLTARSILNQVMLAYRTILAQEELHTTEVTDALTQLANRQAFSDAMDDRPGGEASLLLIDLDDFSGINAACGAAVADELLVRVAGVLREVTRGSDVVARLGEDDFAVLLPGIDQAAAERIAERIVFAVSTLGVDGTGEVATGAGIGVVGVETGADLQGLMIRAQVALRTAKKRGRGQVQTWRPELG